MMFRLWLCLAVVCLVAGDTLFFRPQTPKDITCGDKKFKCPDGATCCELPHGGYGCCPLPKAVCCKDKIHCCAAGDTCDIVAGECKSAKGTKLPWVKKVPARALSTQAQYVICDGGHYQCPNGNTCCRQPDGDFGCCPFLKATCCKDGSHCCPYAYTCDLSYGTCVKLLFRLGVRWQKKLTGAANVLLGSIQEAQTVAKAVKPVLKTQEKQSTQTSAGMKAKVKEVASKKKPASVTKVSKVAAAPPIKPSISKVQQTAKAKQDPKQKVIPRGNEKTPPKEAKSSVPPTNVKMKAKPAQTLPVTNHEGTVEPPKRQSSLPKDTPRKTIDVKHTKDQFSKQKSVKSKTAQSEGDDTQTLKAKSVPVKANTLAPKVISGKAVKMNSEAKTAKDEPKKTQTQHKKPHSDPTKAQTEPKKSQTEPKKDIGSGKLPTQSKKQAGKATPKVEKKKAKKMLESIKDTIHATMNAIKETVHRVVGRSPNAEETAPGKKVKSGKVPAKKVLDGAVAQDSKGGQVPMKFTKQLKLNVQGSTKKQASSSVTSSSKTVQTKGGSARTKTDAKKMATPFQNMATNIKTAPSDLKHKHGSAKEVRQNLQRDQSQTKKQKAQGSVEKSKVKQKKIKTLNLQSETQTLTDKLQKQTEKVKEKQRKLIEIQQLVKQQRIHQQKLKVEKKRKLQQQNLEKEQNLQQQKLKQLKLQQKNTQQQTLEKVKKNNKLPASQQKQQLQKQSQQLKNTQESSQYQSKKLQQQTKMQATLGQQKQHIPPQQKKQGSQKQKQTKTACQQQKQEKMQKRTHEQKQNKQPSPQQKKRLTTLDLKQHAIDKHTKLEKLQLKQKQPYQQSKPKSETTPKKRSVRSSASSEYMGVGRKLLGLAWRYLGLNPSENEVVLENSEIDSDAAHGWDFPAGMDEDDEFVVEGEELEIVEEDAIDLVAAVTCSDKSTCPKGTTCCQLPDGRYGCCPMPKAVCCSDHIHCCKEGETCDVAESRCISKSGIFTSKMQHKLPATAPVTPAWDAPCGSSDTNCPAGSTCCLIAKSVYACCPLPNAMCCSDHTHCCPQDYTCNPDKGQCTKGQLAINWMLKTPARAKVSVANVICPDEISTCPAGSTCCLLESGDYGCCPMSKAVCCADQVHCCPESYTCDPKTAQCLHATASIPWSKKGRASKVHNSILTNIICPDHKSMCPDEATCCKMADGGWGCCPIPDAVCCSDLRHCCPAGTQCNTTVGICTSTTSSIRISLTAVIPRSKVDAKMAMRPIVTIVKCEDGTECPDGNTCCVNSAGKYACCPHPEGTCCSDKLHCCPKGYTCGTTPDECKKESTTISAVFIARILAKKPRMQVPVIEVKCENTETDCPKGSTCCALANGYGCCALPNAVCCSSHFCCPAGHQCDVTGERCIMSLPWSTKAPSSRIVRGEERSFLRRAAKGGHILY